MSKQDQPIPDTHPIPEEAFDWYDEYAHGFIDRRTFMARLSAITTATLTMNVLLSVLMPNYAMAEQINFNDPDILARYVNLPSPKGHGEVRGYLVTPTALKGKAPVVLVIHENRGLPGAPSTPVCWRFSRRFCLECQWHGSP